eukprot:1161036-Pelagomonas_calceolata.AAC.4
MAAWKLGKGNTQDCTSMGFSSPSRTQEGCEEGLVALCIVDMLHHGQAAPWTCCTMEAKAPRAPSVSAQHKRKSCTLWGKGMSVACCAVPKRDGQLHQGQGRGKEPQLSVP